MSSISDTSQCEWMKNCTGTYMAVPSTLFCYIHMYMWQSCVEIEGYSVLYFDRIAAFEVPYH